MSDSFEQLISDMRAVEFHPESTEAGFVDRLSALLAELEPHLLPTYGEQVGVPVTNESDVSDPPIYRELMGQLHVTDEQEVPTDESG